MYCAPVCKWSLGLAYDWQFQQFDNHARIKILRIPGHLRKKNRGVSLTGQKKKNGKNRSTMIKIADHLAEQLLFQFQSQLKYFGFGPRPIINTNWARHPLSHRLHSC
jgi:hypothetical protein